MIRFAEYSDKQSCVELLAESHLAAGFPFPFCDKSASHLFEAHHKLSNCCVIVLETSFGVRGILMASHTQHPFGAGLWAKETVWYVGQDARGIGGMKMLNHYEEWARSQGCSAIGMATLATNDVSRIYERKGYERAETHYLKYL